MFFNEVHSPLPLPTCYTARVRKTENHFGGLDSLKVRSFYLPPFQKVPWSAGTNYPGKIQWNFVRVSLIQ